MKWRLPAFPPVIRSVARNLLLCSALLAFPVVAPAQSTKAVPVSKEPHHHLVFENEYVRVFRVSIPGHDATLMHQHDVPYMYVSLGPADVVNAVAGKPEARLEMADGQIGYSAGHFAHIARTDAGSPFNNFTIELLKPQGAPHNWCDRIVPDAPADCAASSHEGAKLIPSFRTDEIKVFSETLSPKASSKWRAFSDVLVVLLGDSHVNVSFEKQKRDLTAEQAFWIPSNLNQKYRTIQFKNEQKGDSRFLLVMFENKAEAN